MTETLEQRPIARPRLGAPVFPRLPGPAGAAEAYRNLASRVASKLRRRDSESQVLAVTSPEVGSGKTLTSLNLAMAIERLTTLNPLLVEADLWRPTFREHLSFSGAGNLVDYLTAPGASIERSVHLVEGTGLSVIPAGAVDRTLAGREQDRIDELLTAEKLHALAADARRHFALTVIDAPPWFTSSAYRVAEQADAVLIVVRAEHSRRGHLDRLLKELPKEKILGVAFNAERSESQQYAYY